MMKRAHRAPSLALAAAIAATIAAPAAAQADDSWDLTYDVINVLDAGADGGMFGFRLKQVNGPSLSSYNQSGLFGRFYPASTIKVMHHLTAMRWVAQNGVDELTDTLIPVYGNSCSNTNPIDPVPLGDALEAMMVNSDNQMTNAVQDWISQAAINNTAHNVVGMSWETELNHKLGCGGPTNDPANRMTVADITLLYERYVKGELLGAAYMDDFEGLMLNQSNSAQWDSLISSEASSLGLTQGQLDDFMADLRFATKGGNWSDTHVSGAGFVELPNRTCDGVEPLQYAYGLFVDDADSSDAGLMGTAGRALLRGEFRNALRTFKPQALFSCIDQIKTLTPDLGGSVTLSVTYGGATIEIPPDSTYSRVLRMESASVASVGNVPTGLVDIGHGFWFSLIDQGDEVAYPYSGDAALTLSYSDRELRGLVESSLALYRWDEIGQIWQLATAACPGVTSVHDLQGNTLHVGACATGMYALFASPPAV